MANTLCVVHFPFRPPDTTLHSVPLNVRRFAGSSLLEWIVRRVGDAQQVDQIVVVIRETEAASSVMKLLPQDITVFTSQATDSLGQLADVVRNHSVDSIVRISADTPFVDPELIDRLLVTAQAHAACDYIGFSLSDGQPAIRSPIGVFADWFRAQAVLDADQQATSYQDRSDVTRFMCGHPECFQLRLLPVPRELDRQDLRLTVDSGEDWDHILEIFDALGPESLDSQQIAGLLDRQPGMLERMAHLNRSHTQIH